MKEQAIKQKMKLSDLMAEISYIKQKKLQEPAVKELKVNMQVDSVKARVKIMEGEEKKLGEMAKQEELGKKFSEKLK